MSDWTDVPINNAPLVSGLCKDCRYWDEKDALLDLVARCGLHSRDLGTNLKSQLYATAGRDPNPVVVVTSRDFGCIQFEAKGTQ